jgi:hypothetical protein
LQGGAIAMPALGLTAARGVRHSGKRGKTVRLRIMLKSSPAQAGEEELAHASNARDLPRHQDVIIAHILLVEMPHLDEIGARREVGGDLGVVARAAVIVLRHLAGLAVGAEQ